MKKLNVLGFGIIIAAFITACAPVRQFPMAWQKDGGTIDQLEVDRKQCSYEAQKATVTMMNGVESAYRSNELVKSCLEARGWIWKTIPPKK